MFDIISLGIAWMGTLAGAIGALSVGLSNRASKQIWVCFLISNFCWLQRAWYLEDYSLLVQQSAYLVISFIGAWRWFVPKRRCSRADLISINYPACNAAFVRGATRKDKAVLSS